jgi:hypothetical protein
MRFVLQDNLIKCFLKTELLEGNIKCSIMQGLSTTKIISLVLIVRNFLRGNNDHVCNNKRWQISLYRRLLILKLLGSLQPSSTILSTQICSIDTRNDVLNKGSTYKHPQKLPCSCLNVECLMNGIKDMGRFS